MRISVEDIAKVDVRGVRLTISAEGTDLNRSRNWVKDVIIARIAGSGAEGAELMGLPVYDADGEPSGTCTTYASTRPEGRAARDVGFPGSVEDEP